MNGRVKLKIPCEISINYTEKFVSNNSSFFFQHFNYSIIFGKIIALLFCRCYALSLNIGEPRPELANEEFRTADFLALWNDMHWQENSIAKPSLNRLLLIIRGIDILLKTLQEENFGLIECFRQYFETITDPFLLVSEVKGLLKCLARYYCVEDIVDVDMMVNVFQAIYPESGFMYNPTTLQHLCKCNVREIIGVHQEIPMPLAVRKLNIPKRVKDCILCV